MQLIFKNYQTKEILKIKEIDIGAHIPRLHECVIINNQRSQVISVDYTLSEKNGDLFDIIELSLELFSEKINT